MLQHGSAKCKEKQLELSRHEKSEKIDNKVLSAVLHFPTTNFAMCRYSVAELLASTCKP